MSFKFHKINELNLVSLSEDHTGVAEQFTMILANPPFKGSDVDLRAKAFLVAREVIEANGYDFVD